MCVGVCVSVCVGACACVCVCVCTCVCVCVCVCVLKGGEGGSTHIIVQNKVHTTIQQHNIAAFEPLIIYLLAAF